MMSLGPLEDPVNMSALTGQLLCSLERLFFFFFAICNFFQAYASLLFSFVHLCVAMLLVDLSNQIADKYILI